MNIKNEVLIRVYIVLFLVVLAGMILFAQAVKISVVDGEKWRQRGDSLYVKLKTVQADRGNILAEDGSLMATSLPFFEIWMDPNSTGMRDEDFNDNLDTLAYCLATFVDNGYTVGGYRDRLLRKRNEGSRNFLIRRNISYSELKKIKEFPLFRLGQYRGGLIVQKQNKRERPFGMLAHRTIGYIRDDAKPVGLEGYFSDVLGGEEGKRLMHRVAKNTWLPVNDFTEIEPKTGEDIVTTIDVDIQDITQTALLRAMKHHDAKYGSAIVMEVKTGAIRSIANLSKTEDGYWETYNHAVGSATEPGSTFKLPVIMALLEDGYISLEDSIDLEQGKTMFYEEEMVDASFHQLDTTTIRTAFEISSNVGMGKMVQKYYAQNQNAKQFIERLKSFNLHLPTGIEIKGEAVPVIKEAYDKENDWSGTTLPWMSIGYEETVTPLQLLTFYNAVANDGVMMKPYLVSEYQHFGEVIKKFKPTVIKKRVASAKTIRDAKELLLGVVERGTAEKLKTTKYKFAGKTGTAQINYRKFIPRADIKYQASFAGYFPAEDPIYSCIVMVVEPKQHGIYGGEVAGPVFREIADECFKTRIELQKPINTKPHPILANKKLPSLEVGNKNDYEYLLNHLQLPYENNTDKSWTVLRPENDTIFLAARSIQKDIVPNVTGMTLKDALYLLENRGMKVSISGVGKVKKQSIIPGTKTNGQSIKLTLR